MAAAIAVGHWSRGGRVVPEQRTADFREVHLGAFRIRYAIERRRIVIIERRRIVIMTIFEGHRLLR